jgi:hypothetical protein
LFTLAALFPRGREKIVESAERLYFKETLSLSFETVSLLKSSQFWRKEGKLTSSLKRLTRRRRGQVS